MKPATGFMGGRRFADLHVFSECATEETQDGMITDPIG